MTLAKAYKLVKLAIEDKEKKKKEILDPVQQWNQNFDSSREFAKGLSEVLENDIKWLKAIRKQLQPVQHLTKINCRHPKKMHDVADGQKYCMNCNQDLE